MALSAKIYSKTGKGARAQSSRSRDLSADALKILSLIDSKIETSAIFAQLDKLSEHEFQSLLDELERDGYIRLLNSQEWDLGDNFDYRTGMVVDELSIEDFIALNSSSEPAAESQPVKEPEPDVPETSATTTPSAEEVAELEARLEAERKVQEEAGRKEEAARAKAQVEAELAAKQEAERKAQEEEAERLQAAEAVRLKAEQEAHEQAERRAREEEAARQEAEAKLRAQAEKAAKLEAERITREEEKRKVREEKAARRKAAAEARAREEEAARLEAERRAQEEVERKALEEEAVRLQAEDAARVEAEEQAKREAAEQARLEAERTAREAERQAQEEEAARQKAEAIARAQAEEAARQEAERKAQEAAERAARKAEEARQKAEEAARAKAEKAARQETERQAKEEAKRKAREEKELRRQAEAEARAIAKEEARLKAEQKAIEKAQYRAEKEFMRSGVKPARWLLPLVRVFFVYTPLVLLLALGLLHFVNLGLLAGPVEKIASAAIGEPVSVRNLRVSLFPQAHLALSDITVGADKDIGIRSVQVVPELSTLFDEEKNLKSIEINELTVDTASLRRQMQWLESLADNDDLKIGQITLKDLTLSAPGFGVMAFDGSLDRSASGAFSRLELSGVEQNLTLELLPQDDNYRVHLQASNWQMPLVNGLRFDSFNAVGITDGNQVRFSSMEGELYGGSFKATGVLAWSAQPVASGNFELEQVRLSPALSAMKSSAVIEGTLNATATFTSQVNEGEQLADAAEIDASFQVRDGRFNGIDLANHMVSGSGSGNATRFDRLSGKLQLRQGVYQYRQLVLDAPQLKARGNLDVQSNQDVSGTISAELAIPSRRIKSNLAVEGKVGSVRLK
ncbi:MAG: hypothetical protein CVU15_02100 [Betaproteobacteria bacterium HGW-Betaproteobacteria-1]|jgi:hypothetical protein|nr:MAG: hypothetical protein CVU15_02100 [Betaproteobacteria bacterium HGW-Betaproteobacteria-1]